jgi:hypothetical protein
MDPLRKSGGAVDLAEDFQRFLQEYLSGIRQFDAPVRALEKARADFPFKREDLLAQRRLRDAQPVRRLAEVQILGDGHKIP